MKKILGLDLGTNSIGWALIEKDEEKNEGKILGMNSRIISLGEDKTNFEQGKGLTRNANRREKRGSRRLNKRYKQRRNKLIYVLYQLDVLPENQFEFSVDEKYKGTDKIFPMPEKLQHLSITSKRNPEKETNKWKQLTAVELYKLRKDATKDAIDEKDFGRLIYLFNQLRGYAGGGEDDNKEKVNEKQDSDNESSSKKDNIIKEVKTVTIQSIAPKQKYVEKKNNGQIIEVPLFNIEIEDVETKEKYKGECYKEFTGIEETVYDIEIIEKSNTKEQPFFNFDKSICEWQKTKPKKGGETKNIKAKILKCEKPQEFSNKNWIFNLELLDGRKGTISLKSTNEATNYKTNTEKELLITTKIENGITSYEFAPIRKSNWRKQMEDFNKLKAEKEKELNRTVYLGEIFYDILTKDNKSKWERIRNRVILRKHYKEEFKKIWETQISKNTALQNKINDKVLLKKIVEYIYPGKSVSQEKYRKEILEHENGFFHLIFDHIIYYQRPLKPQFRLIGQCQFEKKFKVVPQSHPLHQEEKIWKGINSLSIVTYYDDEKGLRKKRIQPISTEQKEKLYEELLNKPTLTFTQTYSQLGLKEKEQWLEGLNPKATLKGNETRIAIMNAMGKDFFEKAKLYETQNLIDLWRILYNWVKKEYDIIEIDINDYESNPSKYHEYDLTDDDEYNIESERCKALKAFFDNRHIDISDNQILSIAKVRFKRAYSSLSSNALSKIITLVRAGKYFTDEKNVIPDEAKNNFQLLKDNAADMLDRIDEGMNVDYDKEFLKKINDGLLDNVFTKGEMIYSDAVSLFYKRHTATEYTPEHPDYIKNYHHIKTLFRRKNPTLFGDKIGNENDQNNNLRNPVVEQITDEVLQLFVSLCKQYNFKTNENPDEEIEVRIELARELKNNAEARQQMWDAVIAGEKENNWVRKRLRELKNSEPLENTVEIENPEQPSLSNIEKYKLWKKQIKKENEPDKNKPGSEPDKKDSEKYKNWLEQHHISPYTLKAIPLSRLFSKDYEIDHIIPKGRFFDDSLTNKVVCEAIINKEKSNRTPFEYLNAGSVHEEVINWNSFNKFVNDVFKGQKRKNLLMEDIPEDFVERQKKETQYVTLKVKEEIGKIVGTKNVKITTGSITDYLRHEWKLDRMFKEITKPRYELMALQANKPNMVRYEKDDKDRPILKIDLWSKRNDHRHHAIDALVVACTEPKHVFRLNNLNKNLQSWFGEFGLWLNENRIEELNAIKDKEPKEILIALSKLPEDRKRLLFKNIFNAFTEKQKKHVKGKTDFDKWFGTYNALSKEERQEIEKYMPGFRQIEFPWATFCKDVSDGKWIEKMIVSHKPNNKLQIQQRENNKKEKVDFLRIKGRLHEDTYYGKGETYRLPLSKLKEKTDAKKFIETKVKSNFLKKHLTTHLSNYNGKASEAFSDKGIEAFNNYMVEKGFHPVTAIKVDYRENKTDEALQRINRLGYKDGDILVKTGSNYCFAVCEKVLSDGKKERVFDEISLFDAAKKIKESLKGGNNNAAEIIRKYFEEENDKTKGSTLLFTLTINDMVYLPDENEKVPIKKEDEGYAEFWKNADAKKIYRVVKMTKGECYFIPQTFANELNYTPPPKSDVIEDEEENQTEEKKSKEKSIAEFVDGNCTRYVHNESKIKNLLSGRRKKEIKKKLIETLNALIIEINQTADNQEKQDELKSTLIELVMNNIDQDLISEIKKYSPELADFTKQIIYEQKQKEMDDLIVKIQNSDETKPEFENQLVQLLIDFEKFSLKSYLNKKDRDIYIRISTLIEEKNQKLNNEKFKNIRIQDYCIKINVDRLGNISLT